MANKNKILAAAKTAKNDEFYTRICDIENEMKHYWQHFKDAVIFCNCDDPTWSHFWLYFSLNFEKLGLKKLISTHYDEEKSTYKLEYDGTGEPVKTLLEGNGDFRSEECIQLLQEADIVVTNPPFSLFREYIAQLMEYDKKFIILGNPNAVTYKEVFPLLKENKIWLGNKSMSGGMWFYVPQHIEDKIRNGEVKATWKIDKDDRLISNCPAIWYTNLDIAKRHEDLILYKHYTPEEFPTYDNYDAIDVNKVADIPLDYEGVMGVPITCMDKYNPVQFEIIGCADYTGKYGSDDIGVSRIGEAWIEKYREQGGRGHYTANMTSLVYYDYKGKACNTFKRILIRNKKVRKAG